MFENNDISFLEQMLGILVAGFVLITAMELIQSYLAAGLGSRVMGNLRIKMFTHLHQVPFGFYSRTQSGDLISRFSNDLNAIDQAAAISIYKIAHHSLVILASIALLFYFEWHLALFSLLSLPLGAARVIPDALPSQILAFRTGRTGSYTASTAP